MLISQDFEKVDYCTIVALFVYVMSLPWHQGDKHKNVFVFVTDDASYVVKATSQLRIAKKIISYFNDIDTFVCHIKKS